MSFRISASEGLSIENKYTFGEILGRGGFGVVRAATKNDTQEVVAVKIVEKSKIPPEEMERVRQEVEIMKKMDKHPSVIGFHETYETKSKLYIVMEHAEGGHLLDNIIRIGCFTENDARMVMKAILEGVAHMHDNRIMHRDLKPENILLVRPQDLSSLKICDFGLSVQFSDSEVETISDKAGTPLFMAPEIWQKHAVGRAVDIWSCGIIMYILLCGCHPFYHEMEGLDLDTLLERVQLGEFSWHESTLSDSAKDLVLHMLKLDPVERHTALEALNHPWMEGSDLSLAEDTLMDMMRGYLMERKMKAAMKAVYFAQVMNSAIKKT